MIGSLLATTPPDPMISGNWIIAVIGALSSAVALFYGKRQGLREATNNVTIKSPIPMIEVKEQPEYVTHAQLNTHIGRIEDTFEEIKESLDKERGIARTANSNIHGRLDKVMENQAISRGELTQINYNVQRLLDRTERPDGTPKRG